jgi:phosphatidylglycerophosphatase A
MKPALRIPGIITATVFGTGYAPIAPGTAGSLVAALLFLLSRSSLPWWLPLALLAPVTALAYWGCYVGFRLWGDDPSRVNADEFAGCWLACLAVPCSWGAAGICAAFLLFRLFDIIKPWPVSIFDRMKTPAGILLDDLAAGLLTAALIGIGVVAGDLLF